MARHNEIGVLGEKIASQWLAERGHEILERNYLRKYGEIDIVTRETSGNTHFIEVKTVSYETRDYLTDAISRGTWRPEENVHRDKQDRLKRAIQSWLIENSYQGSWQIDVVTVRMVPHEKYAVVKLIENVIFE